METDRIAESIIDYYSNYDEDGRLERHPVEFAVTLHTLNARIGAPGRLLDAATGTGRYARYFAGKGHRVWAEDLVPQNIEILERKVASAPSTDIAVRVNDARDLSVYADGFFDTILYMGPLYHIGADEIAPAIGEAFRVLRTGGTFAFSFVNTFPGYENDKYAQVINCRAAGEISAPIFEHSEAPLDIAACDGPSFAELHEIIESDGLESQAAADWLCRHEPLYRSDEWLRTCRHGLITGRKK